MEVVYPAVNQASKKWSLRQTRGDSLVAAPLFRVAMEPSEENGLAIKSQVMVDKAITVSREKLGTDIGQASYAVMQEIDRCLTVFLGIAR